MKIGVIALIGFAATIPAANWMIGNVGACQEFGPCVIPVGFGLMAPSGVLLIGLALVLRDAVHECLGASWSLFGVAIGAALSFWTSTPMIAVASAAAFAVSETADWSIYTPLREKGRALAVAASGVVGAFVDSLLFVYLAFGSFDFGAGNAAAKIYASATVAALLWWRRK